MAFTTMVGARIRRREDPRLITGRATYVDDVKLVGLLHAAFVRSPYAHAALKRVDLSKAKALAGVYGAWSGNDLRASGWEPSLPVAHKIADLKAPVHSPLALDEVRCVGEAIAVVVACDPDPEVTATIPTDATTPAVVLPSGRTTLVVRPEAS